MCVVCESVYCILKRFHLTARSINFFLETHSAFPKSKKYCRNYRDNTIIRAHRRCIALRGKPIQTPVSQRKMFLYAETNIHHLLVLHHFPTSLIDSNQLFTSKPNTAGAIGNCNNCSLLPVNEINKNSS